MIYLSLASLFFKMQAYKENRAGRGSKIGGDGVMDPLTVGHTLCDDLSCVLYKIHMLKS